jgi:diguanylate cyclase (GGDEF)-like protein
MIHELPSASGSGEERFIRLQERKITLPNNEVGIISIQSDITDKIKSEEKIKYASYHDSLTDLYNRSYLENKIQNLNQENRFPVALIMADLNGLKLVNDTYGHNEGDKLLKKMAAILKDSCRDSDLIARWGGDEFVILLPETDSEAVKKIIERINKKIADTFLEFEDGSRLPLSAALGFGVKKHYFEDVFEILDEAESKMYKNKLTESRSIKSNILNTLLKTLSEKSQETSSHSERMAELATKLAEKIGLTKSEINKLTLIAKLHDIGKTVVPEKILNKKDKLTEAEWKEIRTHPAVGHRVLNATEEFSHISEEVLSHHERWDGSGYPRGLKEEEIPLLARIIAIVDAYDVMTEEQVYKEAISKAEALKEIEAEAGSQFDPKLAADFIELMAE